MNKWFIFFIIVFSGIAGVFFFLIQGQYLLVKLPWFSYPVVQTSMSKPTEVQKEVVCYLSKQGLSLQIKKNILWPQSQLDAVRRVVDLWLTAGVDEGCLSEDVKMRSVALTQQETVALISFDKTFIPPHLSTMERWQLVESLLLTLRLAGVVLEGVYFVQDQSFLQDDYLDFSQRWPIGGYQV
ncbi:hypothetical protein FJ364_03495 [Candidatus Dependentiae bacterium]|nr:hypothetical protein [Candidatus Dependentiae bacterium]